MQMALLIRTPTWFLGALIVMCSSAIGLKIVSIGDWGDSASSGIAAQARVAQRMSDWCEANVCDFILDTGDHFYMDGVDSSDSPRFNTSWKFVYDLPNIDQLVWYMSLGNHDYGVLDTRELFQIEYAKTDPLWHEPWLWYDFQIKEGDTTIQFFVTDTTALLMRKHNPELQLQWLNDTLARSTADWKILIGHAPPYSCGGHAPGTVTMRTQLVPLCEEHGVDVFVSGDEHNLEHISKIADHDVDYIISGGGGRGLYEYDPRALLILESWGLKINYFGYHYGFVVFDIEQTTMKVDFVNEATGEVSYSFTRTK